MAVVFGGDSEYLNNKRYRYLFYIVIFIFLGLALVKVSLFIKSAGLYGALAVLFAMYLIIFIFEKIVFKNSGIVMSGLFGEDKIAKELKALPNEYIVFRGIKVKDSLDCDFTVIGPSGVYAIDAKNHRGLIAFNGNYLTRNGLPLEKDILGEIKAEAFGLKDLIFKTANIDVFVEPVIVFVRASVRLGAGKIDGAYIIGKTWLNELIQNNTSTILDKKIILRLAKGLSELVHDKHKENKLKQLEQITVTTP
jgi:hypothetical protein